MAFIPSSNSVVAFQSDPTKLVGTFSVVGAINPSSVYIVNSPSTLAVNILNTPSPSVIAYQAAGSILAVSGSFTANPQSSINAIQLAGSVMNVNISPSVIAYQLAGSIMAVSATVNTGNSSVQLLQGVAVIGSVAVLQSTSPWLVNVPTPSYISYQAAGSVMAVSGSFSSGNTSVTAFQGGAWSTSVTGGYLNVLGSVIAVQAGGFAITSVVNTVPSSMLVGASIMGTVPVTQSTSPWVVNMPSPSVVATQIAGSVLAVNMPSPSVIAYQLAGSIMAVSATVNTGNSSVQLLQGVAAIGSVATLQGTNPWLVQSLGSVAVAINSTNTSIFTVRAGTQITSVMNTIPSSLLVGASIIGLTPINVVQGVTSVFGTMSIIGTVPVTQASAWISSVQLMSTSASIVSVQNYGYGSVMLMTSTNASVAVLASQNTNPWVIGSIVGTYQEDQAASTSDKGLFVLHVRNDTLSSVTNADLDYSALSVGPVGEMITANSPITKWIQGVSSVFTGVSVQVLAAQGTSIFTYVTGIQMINPSANNAYVTFTQGIGAAGASTIGWGIVPANGGTNMVFPNPLRTLDNRGVSASVNAVASIYVMMQGFTSKT